MNLKRCILCFITLISITVSYAQTITYSASNKSLPDVLHDLEQISTYRFSYNSNIIQADKTVTVTFHNATIEACMSKILSNNYNYSIVGNQIIITERKQQTSVQPKRTPPQTQQKEKTIVVYDTVQVIDHITIYDTIVEKMQVVDTLQHVEVITQQRYVTSNLHTGRNCITFALQSGPLSNAILFYNGGKYAESLRYNHTQALSCNAQFTVTYKHKRFLTHVGAEYYNFRLGSSYTATAHKNEPNAYYTDTLWYWRYFETFSYYKFSDNGDSVKVTALDSTYTFNVVHHQKKIEETTTTNSTLSWHYVTIPIGIGYHFTPTSTFAVQPFITLNTMLLVSSRGEIISDSGNEPYSLSNILKPITFSGTIACKVLYAIEKEFAVSIQPYLMVTPSVFRKERIGVQGLITNFGVTWGINYTIPYDKF